MKLAELLMVAEGDPKSEAGLLVAKLVKEAIKLNSCISICNPTGFRTFHCNRMEEDTGEGANQAPSRDVWYPIMVRGTERGGGATLPSSRLKGSRSQVTGCGIFHRRCWDAELSEFMQMCSCTIPVTQWLGGLSQIVAVAYNPTLYVECASFRVPEPLGSYDGDCEIDVLIPLVLYPIRPRVLCCRRHFRCRMSRRTAFGNCGGSIWGAWGTCCGSGRPSMRSCAP